MGTFAHVPSGDQCKNACRPHKKNFMGNTTITWVWVWEISQCIEQSPDRSRRENKFIRWSDLRALLAWLFRKSFRIKGVL